MAKLDLLAAKRRAWAERKAAGPPWGDAREKEGDTGMRRRAYFVTAMTRSFDDHGLRLFDSAKQTPPPA